MGLHLTKFTPVIASPCEIKDNAYGRIEGKVYSPQNNMRPTAILYFTGAWQSYNNGWDCWAPFSRSTLCIWCRIRSIHATRCVAMLLAMTRKKEHDSLNFFRGRSLRDILFERRGRVAV